MAKTKKLIDELIAKRSKGDSFLELDVQMKLVLKGINVKNITENTPDNPETIKKIYQLAEQMNIELSN